LVGVVAKELVKIMSILYKGRIEADKGEMSEDIHVDLFRNYPAFEYLEKS
jgi:hypothetical protein